MCVSVSQLFPDSTSASSHTHTRFTHSHSSRDRTRSASSTFYTRTHTKAHTHTHTYTLTHTCTRTHIHTHAHTLHFFTLIHTSFSIVNPLTMVDKVSRDQGCSEKCSCSLYHILIVFIILPCSLFISPYSCLDV